MKAETILKRINAKRKEITRHEKEIEYYKKEWLPLENLNAEGERWCEYHRKHICRIEAEIAVMSKQAAELATEDEFKALIKAKAEDMARRGFKREGYTAHGLRYIIDGNNGWTERSRHCWTMFIEGRGMVFTSGTLETVAEYILRN